MKLNRFYIVINSPYLYHSIMESIVNTAASLSHALAQGTSSITSGLVPTPITCQAHIAKALNATHHHIHQLSDTTKIRDLLSQLPTPHNHTKLWDLNIQWMEASLDANRNIVVPSDVLNLLDPTCPLDQLFTYQEHLGSGCFGTVSLWQSVDGRQFAIKEIKHEIVSALVEFKTGLALNHPNIVKIHHLVTKITNRGSPRAYVIMEYVPGNTLWEVKDSLTYRERTAIFSQLKSAVIHCAEKGIVPIDLHGQNMIVGPDKALKLIDLGLYQNLQMVVQHGHKAWGYGSTLDGLSWSPSCLMRSEFDSLIRAIDWLCFKRARLFRG